MEWAWGLLQPGFVRWAPPPASHDHINRWTDHVRWCCRRAADWAECTWSAARRELWRLWRIVTESRRDAGCHAMRRLRGLLPKPVSRCPTAGVVSCPIVSSLSTLHYYTHNSNGKTIKHHATFVFRLIGLYLPGDYGRLGRYPKDFPSRNFDLISGDNILTSKERNEEWLIDWLTEGEKEKRREIMSDTESRLRTKLHPNTQWR